MLYKKFYKTLSPPQKMATLVQILFRAAHTYSKDSKKRCLVNWSKNRAALVDTNFEHHFGMSYHALVAHTYLAILAKLALKWQISELLERGKICSDGAQNWCPLKFCFGPNFPVDFVAFDQKIFGQPYHIVGRYIFLHC